MAFDYTWDFDDDSTHNLALENSVDNPDPVISTDVAYSGTKSLKCVANTTGSVFACNPQFRFGNASAPWSTGSDPKNPAAVLGGFWVDHWMYISEADAAHMAADVNPARQWKLQISRQDIDAGGSVGAWLQVGFGENFQLTDFREIRAISDPGAPAETSYVYAKGSAGNGGGTAFVIPGGSWFRNVYHYQRDVQAALGRCRMWLNDELVIDTGWNKAFGTNDLNKEQSVRVGIPTIENHAQTITCYIDNLRITSSPIYAPGRLRPRWKK